MSVSSQVIFFADFDDPGGSYGLLGGAAEDQEGNTAVGDSGGAWFLEENGTTYLMGIASGGYLKDSEYGDLNSNTRTGKFNDWISRSIPEPRSILLTIAFVLLCLFNKKQI